MSDDPNYRRPLNEDQIKVLQLLYRFRFATCDLVAQYFGKKSGIFAYNRLTVLQEQGLIGRRYDKRYRILGRPAEYYLLPAGAKALREADKAGKYGRGLYKETRVSDSQISRSLTILEAYNHFRGQFGQQLTFSTKTDFAAIESFPKRLPDAFIRLQTEDKSKCYFLDIYQDTQPFFEAVRKIKGYLEYKGSGGWSLPADFPVILSICASVPLQKRLLHRIAFELRKSWNDDVVFAATVGAQLGADGTNIWLMPRATNKQLPLLLLS